MEKVIGWLIDQKEKAKVAWVTVGALLVYLTGLYDAVSKFFTGN